jgi:hypothetical protein
VLNLIERLDKILVPLFYTSPQLAQISIFTGILNFSRVIPDTQIRIRQNQVLNNEIMINNKSNVGIVRTYSLMFLVVVTGYFFVWITLGSSWLLPFPIIALLVIYEIAVWNAKENLSVSQSIFKKNPGALNLALAIFYLIPLPLLMYRFDYIQLLLILISAIGLFLFVNKVRTGRELS